MVEAKAVVISAEQGRARVRVSDRQEGCGRCDEPGGCRAVRMAYAVRPARTEFTVPDPIGVRAGESVVLRMEDGAPLKGALASYGLGVVLLVAGAALGHGASAGSDLFALLGAASGLVLAGLINRALYRSRRWRGALRLEMVRDDEMCRNPDPVHSL